MPGRTAVADVDQTIVLPLFQGQVPGQAEQAGGHVGGRAENEPHNTNGLPHRSRQAAGTAAVTSRARPGTTSLSRAEASSVSDTGGAEAQGPVVVTGPADHHLAGPAEIAPMTWSSKKRAGRI